MSTFVLVHGSWHGGWCWQKIVDLLEEQGHRVFAPDLPSLGADDTPIREIEPNTWSNSIIELLDSIAEPDVVLVGHSRGGLIISQVAEARPEKISKLVYLCAFLLKDGQMIGDIIGASESAEAKLPSSVVVGADGLSTTVQEAALQELFYNECSDEDVDYARRHLKPEAMLPLQAPLSISERFHAVERVYIECVKDNAILIDLQQMMHRELPCSKVITMDTDHSPFFSSPEELTSHLVDIAAD